ncbi:MAG: hypothetical protein GX642_14175 [Smithella sp.]|nr:hypothetical protein [Smithella sp.]
MSVNLFSLALKVGGWLLEQAAGHLLDTLLSCGNCGHEYSHNVFNQRTSDLLCPRCQTWLDQYTNATSHTINKNKTIAAAYVSDLHWESWGGFWGTAFNPHFEVDCVNSRYEDLVVKIMLSRFQGSIFYQDETILRPSYERTHWGDVWWKVSRDRFPDTQCTFAVDVFVFNTWGEELHRVRSLGNWSGKS